MTAWKPITGSMAVVAFCFGPGPARAQHPHGPEGHAPKEPKEKKPAFPECPVMGDPVDFSVKIDAPNGPVYFCCRKCIKKFVANPARYADEVAAQRKAVAALPKVQVSCPLTGKPIDEKIFVERKGEKIYFCCEGCQAKFRKQPGKYVAKLAGTYTYQTKCPVMGEDIDPTAFITLSTGQTVFFCCKGCDKKFLKDPAKYAPKLEAQGTKIDPEKVTLARKDARRDAAEPHAHEGHGGSHDH